MSQPKILFFTFLAYLWSLVDDIPLNADVLLGSQGGHYAMEAILHVLTILFLFLAVREAFPTSVVRSSRVEPEKVLKVAALAALAFLTSSLDDILAPFDNGSNSIAFLMRVNWYPLDIAEHVISLAFFYFAIREARRWS